MLPGSYSSKFSYNPADTAKVMAKTPHDLAESLEIMMVETRPTGLAREALRGAVAMLTGAPTNQSKDAALTILVALQQRWRVAQMPPRVLICERAMNFIKELPDA